MLESRSSVFKMFQEQAQKDRQISKFPPPYRIDATKNKTKDFNPSVKKVCYSSPYCFTGFRLAKVIIIGDVAVGKTSLINRFCHQIFDTNYKATIGVDFEVERFDILQTPFNLQIWDTAGQERFKSIASSYYRGAHVVIIVFNMTDPVTLTHSTEWFGDALKANSHSPLIFLVGTKKDLFRSPKSFSEVESRSIKFANELGAELWCVSSRTGEGIMEMFHRIAALAFEIVVMKSLSHTEQIVVGSDLVSMERPPHTPKKQKIKCTACA